MSFERSSCYYSCYVNGSVDESKLFHHQLKADGKISKIIVNSKIPMKMRISPLTGGLLCGIDSFSHFIWRIREMDGKKGRNSLFFCNPSSPKNNYPEILTYKNGISAFIPDFQFIPDDSKEIFVSIYNKSGKNEASHSVVEFFDVKKEKSLFSIEDIPISYCKCLAVLKNKRLAVGGVKELVVYDYEGKKTVHSFDVKKFLKEDNVVPKQSFPISVDLIHVIRETSHGIYFTCGSGLFFVSLKEKNVQCLVKNFGKEFEVNENEWKVASYEYRRLSRRKKLHDFRIFDIRKIVTSSPPHHNSNPIIYKDDKLKSEIQISNIVSDSGKLNLFRFHKRGSDKLFLDIMNYEGVVLKEFEGVGTSGCHCISCPKPSFLPLLILQDRRERLDYLFKGLDKLQEEDCTSDFDSFFVKMFGGKIIICFRTFLI